MIRRGLVLVAGPRGAGKTTLIEHLLQRESRMLMAARCIRDDDCTGPKETTSRTQPELKRYRRAGAAGAVEYRFPEHDANLDSFYGTRFMQEYSEGVILEGDAPVEHVDLSVFVAPALPPGGSLFRRATRDRAREKHEDLARAATLLGTPEGTKELVKSYFGETLARLVMVDQGGLEALSASLREILAKERAAPGLPSTEHWAIADGYEGIEHAQVVVANIREAGDRAGAERLLDELARLRKDESIFRDILGWRGQRVPITAVVADLADGADAGLKKALARIRRAFRTA